MASVEPETGALRGMFAEAGTLAILERKGFRDLEVVIDCAGRALPHTLVIGSKGGAPTHPDWPA